MKGSANAAWITLSGYAAPVRRRSTVTGPKIAAVERREARVLDRKSTRRLSRGVNLLPKRRPALRSLTHVREKEMQASPLRLTNAGADGARLYVGGAPSRCLICESVSGAPLVQQRPPSPRG